jgi:exodeoxyribonuclease VII large subunit
LKQKLAAEGLFDADLKRSLPAFPRQVGLITSAGGAAVRDLLSVLQRRFPALPVVIYPAQVQGEEAAGQLLEMIRLANTRAECDLLVLARGGGSLEDLAPFNDEALARAVRGSAIPVVTGIGHEIDFTIADLAADRRAATPSAAAELISPDRVELVQRLAGLGRRLRAACRQRLSADSARLRAAQRHLLLLHPAVRLQQQQQRVDELERRLGQRLRALLDARAAKLQTLRSRLGAQAPLSRLEGLGARAGNLEERLARAMRRLLERRGEHLAGTVATLQAVSPLATLARGYAIVSLLPQRAIVRDAAEVKTGDRVEARLAQGRLVCRVEDTLSE